MSQPAWKAELSRDIEAAIGLNMDCGGAEGVYRLRDVVLKDVMPHIEAAFKRGHDVAKLRQGSRLVVENERLRRELEHYKDSYNRAYTGLHQTLNEFFRLRAELEKAKKGLT
ncbi:hypothetical protein OG949_33120 [Streptomyces scopuliridis]|uniref:hypothetical protein n=1 Tax=Streptomyces scopuliridis TaxID=452529 RepID=UPI002DD8DC4A|nr:hypothetical protein [Streptomyces scopuliridis]WSB37210.1 hypothetical protein OG949_33120 [Streptomyces scopuliridis]